MGEVAEIIISLDETEERFRMVVPTQRMMVDIMVARSLARRRDAADAVTSDSDSEEPLAVEGGSSSGSATVGTEEVSVCSGGKSWCEYSEYELEPD